jgi:tRNA (guanosine-2'-O-)-methyltransferase
LETQIKEKLLDFLSSFITNNRKNRIDDVVNNRTKYISVIVEDIFQAQNASAILRTCDCLGIQDIHIIENFNDYNVNPDIALGSDKWLSLYHYNEAQRNNAEYCFNYLHDNGYKIIATSPHKYDCSIEDFHIKSKIAVLFGNEQNGISSYAFQNADIFLKVPMFGFTESFNVSVSAGIILYNLISKLKKTNIDWKLTEDEKIDIKLNWYRNSIKKVEQLEKNL